MLCSVSSQPPSLYAIALTMAKLSLTASSTLSPSVQVTCPTTRGSLGVTILPSPMALNKGYPFKFFLLSFLLLNLPFWVLIFCLQVDLVGGYYDAGDNVKFGLPMAFTITLLSWGVIEYGDLIAGAGQYAHALEAIKWGTDYFIKAHTHPHVLWAQVILSNPLRSL